MTFNYETIGRDAPLFQTLADRPQDVMGLHMPGNLQGKAFPPGYREGFSRFETTELKTTGDMLQGSGIFAEAEAKLRAYFDSKYSYFITQGSSTGLHAMLLAAARPGDQILLPRTVHYSIVHAMALLRLEPVFLPLEVREGSHLPQLDLEGAYRVIRNHPEAVACLVTRPDYYGEAEDLTKLAALLHDRDQLLLVDAAHGPHFTLEGFPVTALAQGADLVIQSAHKMLPALAPGAILHIGRDSRVTPATVRRALRVWHSSSPSFPIAASIDWARSFLKHEGTRISERLLTGIAQLSAGLPEGFEIAKQPAGRQDPCHVVLHLPGAMPPPRTEDLLLTAGIEAEFVRADHLLLLLPLTFGPGEFNELGNRLLDFAERFNLELNRVPLETQRALREAERLALESYNTVPATDLTRFHGTLFVKDQQTVSLTDATGETAAVMLAPYPPGQPLVWPGETLSQDMVELLCRLLASGIEITGLEEGRVPVLAKD